MTTTYRQCHLMKIEETGHVEQVAWIPSEFARMKNVLRIRDELNKQWVGGWVVTWVGADDVDEACIAPYSYGQIRRSIRS